MDYYEKKSYRTIIIAVIIVLGFFFLAWFQESIIQIVHVGQTGYIEYNNNSIDMVHAVRKRNEIIARLRTENLSLFDSLQNSSSSPIVSKDIPPRAQPHILVVAGHTAKTKGAVFGDTTEYELTYDLMNKVKVDLEGLGFNVTVSHNQGDYSYRFSTYFTENKDQILQYRKDKLDAFHKQYPLGVVTNDTDHNLASDAGVAQLYGINKWVNENNIDAVVHLHFNDYPGRLDTVPGKHTGFAIFIPLKTNDNFVLSYNLAKKVESRLLEHSSRSTLTSESAGVLESELIAVGQANSVQIPAILIENGYIYEQKFTDTKQRPSVLERYSRSIADAIDDFFVTNDAL